MTPKNIHAIVPEGKTLDYIYYKEAFILDILENNCYEDVEFCFTWSRTKQGREFWSNFCDGDNQEEGMAILENFLYGTPTFNEEDIWE